MRASALLLCCALVLCVVSVPAARAGASMSEGNAAYARGAWEEAQGHYQALVDEGASNSELFYNLGNALLRQESLGPAIYAYERALAREPGHQDARANLELARAIVAERTTNPLPDAEPPPWWIALVCPVPEPAAAAGLLVSNALLFALLVFWRRPKGKKRLALALGAITLALSGVVLCHAGVDRFRYGAVIVSESAVLRTGPDAALPAQSALHPGLRGRLRAEEGDWLRLEFGGRVVGWVPRRDVGLFRQR